MVLAIFKASSKSWIISMTAIPKRRMISASPESGLCPSWKPDSAAAEREIFGVTHAEVGAYLLGLWGIPFPIVEAVAFHHRPNEVAPESRPLVAAIHIASGLIDEMTEAGGAQPPPGSNVDSSSRIDVSFLREAGLEEVFKKSRAEAEKLLGGVAERS
jgi:hypothetical protein